MTDKLPPNLLQLFQPRYPVLYLPPADKPPEDRHTNPIDGVSSYIEAFNEYKKEYNQKLPETHMQRRDRLKREKAEKHQNQLADGLKNYKPSEDPNAKGDAFATLFVSRLDRTATSHDVQKVFGRYGPIERV